MPSNWINYHPVNLTIPKINKPTVLGFSAYFHDSSACLIKDNKILAAVDEERFSRIKHDNQFPERAISYCLKEVNVKPDLVVFFENPERKFERIKETITNTKHSESTYKQIFDVWERFKTKERIQERFNDSTGLKNEIIFLDHHLSHAASAYYVSGFSESVVVTIDGVGEKTTTAIGIGRTNKLSMLKEIEFPNSIGLLYTALTVFLGFRPFDGEYKVMGLASYGNQSKLTNKFYKLLHKTVDIFDDGSFSLNMNYFGHNSLEMKAFRPELEELLTIQARQEDFPITKRYEDIASALQLITEDLVLGILNYAQNLTQCENLSLAGGVALNSVINAKIKSNTDFKNIFIQPASGDSGTSLGATKYIQNLSDKESTNEILQSAYLGPSYSDEYIENILRANNIKFTVLSNDDEIIKRTAKLLSQNKIIGWFQGRMEWGPRALGARSILASPLNNKMKDILNAKIKHREMFRPFAPVVCIDDVEDFFVCDTPIPSPTDYMLMVYPIKKEKQKLIPAVTHIDGTGRLQTIRRNQNPLYFNLIKEFGKITGVPILINTSFNLNKEPIVCSPLDAINCFNSTNIDYLIMNKFVISKK